MVNKIKENLGLAVTIIALIGADYIKLEKTTNTDITLPSTLYIGENF